VKKYVVNAYWVICAIILFDYALGWGSGGSMVSSGAFNRLSGNDTGYRQFIKLQDNGDSFIAKPVKSSIRLITLKAPGLKKGTLIIREIDLPNKEKSVLITAPKKACSQIKRATIFLSPPSNTFFFYQEDEDGWQEIQPTRLIAVEESKRRTTDGIWAYPVDQLGHFRLSQNPLSVTEDRMSGIKNNLFPMGSLHTGIFPTICAGVVFLFVSILSYVIHKIECIGTH
jgi:hypothetical protein